MPGYFLDSSALVKRYVVETGTNWVRSLFHPAGANQFSVASITGVEVVAAIARRSQGGGLSAAEAVRITRSLRRDFHRDFDIIEVDSTLIQSAMDLAEQHALRGYDAVQLAAALAVHSTAQLVGTTATLISSDLELNAAATTGGLAVEDPNNHP